MRGVALVQALVVVVALSALALALTQRAGGAQQRLQAQFGTDQAALYLDAGMDLLRETLPRGPVHPGQDWASPRDDVVIGEARLSWRAHDLQGRFNLGWVHGNPTAAAALDRLLAQRGLSADHRAEVLALLAQRPLPDWGLPGDIGPLSPPVQAALRPMLDLLAILPPTRRINLATLAPEVLAALTPALSDGQRQALRALVADSPGAPIDDVLARLGEAQGDEVQAIVAGLGADVTSSSFLLWIEVRLDSLRLRRAGVVDTADPLSAQGDAAALRLAVPLVE